MIFIFVVASLEWMDDRYYNRYGGACPSSLVECVKREETEIPQHVSLTPGGWIENIYIW